MNAVAFSPDGTVLVTVGARGDGLGHLTVWDLASAKRLVYLVGRPAMTSVSYSPDGRTLACGDVDGFIRLRDPSNGKERAVLKAHALAVQSVAFSPDGAAVVSAGLDGTARLWDLKRLEERRVFRGHTGGVLSAAFSPDGLSIVTGGEDQTARIWDVQFGNERFALRSHTGPVQTVAVSPTGTQVATAGRDGTVRLWNCQTGKEQVALQAGGEPAQALSFTADGKWLAEAAGQRICLWDAQTFAPIGKLERQTSAISALALSPDSKYLATGSPLGLVLLSLAWAEGDAMPAGWQEYRQSLRGLAEMPAGWEFKDDVAQECVRLEPEGVRITLPAGKPPTGRGTGVTSFPVVKGDFEITASFEILHEPEPDDALPRQTRISLEAILDKPRPLRNMAALTRSVRGDGKMFGARAILHDDEADPPETVYNGEIPTQATAGRFRLKRSGSLLAYYVAEGLNGEFVLLRQFPFGPENLREVRMCASTGGPRSSFDLRVTEVSIRAEALTNLDEFQAGGASPLQKALWWLGGILLGLVLSLLRLWLWNRRRRRTPRRTATLAVPGQQPR